MSDIHQHVEAILRTHQWSFIKHGCRCDDAGTVGEWPAHAAEVLVRELGLIEFESVDVRWWATKYYPAGE